MSTLSHRPITRPRPGRLLYMIGLFVIGMLIPIMLVVLGIVHLPGGPTPMVSQIVVRKAPELPQVEWINSPPLTMEQLRGKVVMIDFWEYTCVNCLRTLPYVEEWNKRYADRGLVIIGVHTPEFAFGKSKANVEAAVARLGISYPVAVDSDYKIWNAYHNQYWPHKFLIDKNGSIVYDHAGEGDYQDTEHEIQKLLRQIDPAVALPAAMPYVRDTDKPGAVCYPVTQETYAGYERGAYAHSRSIASDRVKPYTNAGGEHPDGKIVLQGEWEIGPERARYAGPAGKGYLLLKYHAVEINAVMKRESSAGPFRVYVEQNGKPLTKANKGANVTIGDDGRSYLTIDAPRMYNITSQKEFGTYELKLYPESDVFGLYAFTFGSCER